MKIENQNIDKLLNVAESLGWTVNVNYDDNSIVLQQNTPAHNLFQAEFIIPDVDKDENMEIDEFNDIQTEFFIDCVKDYIDRFDVSSETYSMLNSEGHGEANAPYDMRDAYNDIEAMSQNLDKLFNAFCDAYYNENYSKYTDEYYNIKPIYNNSNQDCVTLVLKTAESLGWEVDRDNDVVKLTYYTNHDIPFNMSEMLGYIDPQDVNREPTDIEMAMQLSNAVSKIYDDFDVSEETYKYLDNKGHGKKGLPYDMKEILDDMIEITDKLEELSINMNSDISLYKKYSELQTDKSEQKKPPKVKNTQERE